MVGDLCFVLVDLLVRIYIHMESLEVLFFGMEKHNLFERMIDFTESLSIRNCKVLSNFSQEMFSYRKSCTKLTTSSIPHFIFWSFQVSIDVIMRFFNWSCSITLGGSSVVLLGGSSVMVPVVFSILLEFIKYTRTCHKSKRDWSMKKG